MKAAGGCGKDRSPERKRQKQTKGGWTVGFVRGAPVEQSSLLGLWTAKLAARVFVDLSFDA